MALGAVVHATLVIILLYWRPDKNNPYIFFGMSGMWGVGDAVWQTQVNGEFSIKSIIIHSNKSTSDLFLNSTLQLITLPQ